jgi:hypothetical protein
MFRKRLVPDASDLNTLVVYASDSGCCPDTLTKCKYRVVVDPYTNFASITVLIDGEEVTIDFPASVTDKTLLPAAIRTALETVGFVSDDSPKGAPKDVVVATDGTEVTIDIWGEAVILSLTTAADVAHEATEMCEKYVRCLHSVTIPFAATSIIVDGGAPESLNGGDPYATGEAATVKADIEASTYLELAESVTVTENVADEEFDITFYFSNAAVSIGGVATTKTNCKQDFQEPA